MTPLISVIIPVYNSARWLSRCLESVCGQTLENIEIICVDDGSSDDSPAILEAYARRDPRIRLHLLGMNRGVSTARNIGIAAARGEWLSFVDSDDFLLRTFYEDLYAASTRAAPDIIKGEIWGYDNEDKRVVPREFYAINPDIRRNKAYFCFGFTSAIFRRQLIVANALSFPTELINMEDPCFTIMAALKARSISTIGTAAYFYAHNPESVTKHPGHMRQLLVTIRKACELMTAYLKKENVDADSHHIILAFLVKQLRYAIGRPELPDAEKSACQNTLSLMLSMFPAAEPELLDTKRWEHSALSAVDKIRLAMRCKELDKIVRQQLQHNP